MATETFAPSSRLAGDGVVNGWAVLAEKDSYDDVKMTNLPIGYTNILQLRQLLLDSGWQTGRIYEIREFDRASLRQSLSWLAKNADMDDVALFYVAAHGKYMSDVIKWSDFVTADWAAVPSQKRVLVVDTCQAGALTAAVKGDSRPYLSIAAVDKGEYGWSGLEEEKLPIIGGVFTHYFAAAFANPKADSDGNGQISVQEAARLAETQQRTYMHDVVLAVREYLEGYHKLDSYPERDPGFPHVIVDDAIGKPIYLKLGQSAAPGKLGDIWTRRADGMTMVYVPAGEFKMGSDDDDFNYARQLCKKYGGDDAIATCRPVAFADEQPAHTVVSNGFWIDRTEVTNKHYRRCVEAQACTAPVDGSSYTRKSYYGNSIYDNYPVIWVNQQQASNYCKWAGARLPTEAEWEYAARGSEGRIFPWGNTFDGKRLNYCDARCEAGPNDKAVDDGYADTAPVGSFSTGVSWCGALDLAGNVREWVADWYGRYPPAQQVNPTGPISGTSRIPRGGSWLDTPDDVRSTNRGENSTDYTRHKVGFRCAKNSDAEVMLTPTTPPPKPTPAPTPTSAPSVAIDDAWLTYTNAKYGFSFRYPPDWTLKAIAGPVNTMSGHAVHLTHPNDPAVRMIVAFKRAAEDARITPTGIGSGELVSRGAVSLLGQEVERIVLVAAGKDMAVYYGWPRLAATSADLIFWLALDCACSAGDPAVTGLTPEVERIADAVVESIEVQQ